MVGDLVELGFEFENREGLYICVCFYFLETCPNYNWIWDLEIVVDNGREGDLDLDLAIWGAKIEREMKKLREMELKGSFPLWTFLKWPE